MLETSEHIINGRRVTVEVNLNTQKNAQSLSLQAGQLKQMDKLIEEEVLEKWPREDQINLLESLDVTSSVRELKSVPVALRLPDPEKKVSSFLYQVADSNRVNDVSYRKRKGRLPIQLDERYHKNSSPFLKDAPQVSFPNIPNNDSQVNNRHDSKTRLLRDPNQHLKLANSEHPRDVIALGESARYRFNRERTVAQAWRKQLLEKLAFSLYEKSRAMLKLAHTRNA